MQLQGLMLVMFMLIIVPVMLLFANDSIFFAVTALVLTIVSIKDIKAVFKKTSQSSEEMDEELAEELEDMVNIDLKRFGTGIKVVKSLLVIMFLFYCAFYIKLLAAKVIITLLIIYKISLIRERLKPQNTILPQTGMLPRLMTTISGSGTLIITLVTAFNKFIKTII